MGWVRGVRSGEGKCRKFQPQNRWYFFFPSSPLRPPSLLLLALSPHSLSPSLSPHMSRAEIQQAKDVFTAFDTDRDGALTYPQTYDALFSLGYDITVGVGVEGEWGGESGDQRSEKEKR